MYIHHDDDGECRLLYSIVVNMASSAIVFPRWLLDCKDHISQTKEWNVFLSELHEAIQQQLTESHVQYFTDLSEAEKTLFMERAIRAIETGGVFGSLYSQVSVLLDQHLNEEVSRELMEDHPIGTKTDLIVSNAEEGAVSLLRRWPEMRTKLHVCLNQPLPSSLRSLTWKLFLSNAKIRKQYVDVMSKHPRKAISPFDLEISQKCENLLSSEPTFSTIKGSVGAFYAMKAVLSYHHALSGSANRLPDIDYMLVVPLVLETSSTLSRRDPAPAKTVTLLVEEFLSFMSTRPGYMLDSGSESRDTEVTGFTERVARIIEEQDPELAKDIAKQFVTTQDKIITTEAAGHGLFVDGLKFVILPVIRAMFVGYLNAETLLYIWDQYMIGLDTPGFSDELLSAVMATMFILLGERLRECTSTSGLESVLQTHGVKLIVPQFQYQIKHKHYSELYRMLEKDNKAAIPVLDPTQGQHPPWQHWFNDVIPPYTRPPERRRAREEREAERDRLLRQQMDVEKFAREQEERERKASEEEYKRRMAEEQVRSDEDKRHLQERLSQEEAKRAELERKYQEEIERLRLEIGALKNQQQQQRPVSTYSVASYISRVLVPPPPTAASSTTSRNLYPQSGAPTSARVKEFSPVRENAVTPAKVTSPYRQPQSQTEDAILDFLRRIHHSVNRIGHGEGTQKTQLDSDTKDYMRAHINDVKRAEMEIFSRNLDENEFNSMSPETQKETSDRMMTLIQQYRDERSRRPQRGRRR
ncbi:uncharacterized protein LOC135476947 [Liolophura sinensis]|uniref:uncharacterized protein LOC135476947 n=1 Tax=Liolophura sinensis TaxID=3198878 RepID=UPI003159845D